MGAGSLLWVLGAELQLLGLVASTLLAEPFQKLRFFLFDLVWFCHSNEKRNEYTVTKQYVKCFL